MTFALIRSLASFAKSHNHSIEAIAFTGQMHGGLIVGSTLQPLTNFITWQDKRGDEMDETGRTYVESLRNLAKPDPTGVGIHTGFLVSTLYWLRSNNAIPENAAHVLGIYDWLASLLVRHAVSDISSVAAWGMYDPVEFRWRTDLLERAGLSGSLLPEVAEPGAILGNINPDMARELGLNIGIRIHASIGDTQAAYLGSECQPDEVLLNFGTGSQSMWVTALPIATEGTDIRYLRTAGILCVLQPSPVGKLTGLLPNFSVK